MWGSTSTTRTREKDRRVQIQRWGQWRCWGHLCGVEHVFETVCVRVISTSKPVISNVFNRVTRDSSSRRMKDHVGPDPSCMLQPANVRTPASEPAAVSPASQCVWGGRGSSIISEPSSKPDYKMSSLETVLQNSELLSLRPHCLSGAVLSLGGKDESPLNSKRCPTSGVNCSSGNPKRLKLSDGIPGGPASTVAPPGISPGKTRLWPWKIPWPHRAMFMVGHPFHRLTPMTRMLPSYGSRRNMEFVMAGENGLFDSCTSEQDCWSHESKSGIKFTDESKCYLIAFTLAAYKRRHQNRRLIQPLNDSAAWVF